MEARVARLTAAALGDDAAVACVVGAVEDVRVPLALAQQLEFWRGRVGPARGAAPPVVGIVAATPALREELAGVRAVVAAVAHGRARLLALDDAAASGAAVIVVTAAELAPAAVAAAGAQSVVLVFGDAEAVQALECPEGATTVLRWGEGSGAHLAAVCKGAVPDGPTLFSRAVEQACSGPGLAACSLFPALVPAPAAAARGKLVAGGSAKPDLTKARVTSQPAPAASVDYILALLRLSSGDPTAAGALIPALAKKSLYLRHTGADRREEAVEEVELLVKCHTGLDGPDGLGVCEDAVRFLARVGERDAALRALRHLQEVCAPSVALHCLAGAVLDARDEDEEAAAEFEAALALDPECQQAAAGLRRVSPAEPGAPAPAPAPAPQRVPLTESEKGSMLDLMRAMKAKKLAEAAAAAAPPVAPPAAPPAAPPSEEAGGEAEGERRRQALWERLFKKAHAKAHEGHFLLEDGVRMSQSVLWELQKQYYARQGLDAWANSSANQAPPAQDPQPSSSDDDSDSEGEGEGEGEGGGEQKNDGPKDGDTVPFFITSNGYIADAYARVLYSFMREAAGAGGEGEGPFYIVELGTGPAKFTSLFLSRLCALADSDGDVDFMYVATDFTDANVSTWEARADLQWALERGVLDFCTLDCETGTELHLLRSGRTLSPAAPSGRPIIVLANYLFDSLATDAFHLESGRLHESLVTSYSTRAHEEDRWHPDILYRIKRLWRYREVRPDGYYEDEALNELLRQYVRELPGEANFTMPVSGLDCLRRLSALGTGGLCALVADKAFNRASTFAAIGDPNVALHGSPSIMVNLDAVGRWALAVAGSEENALVCHSPQRCASLDVSLVSFGVPRAALRRTQLAFEARLSTLSVHDWFVVRDHFDSCRPEETIAAGADMARFVRAFCELCAWDADLLWQFKDLLAMAGEEGRVCLERLWSSYRAEFDGDGELRAAYEAVHASTA